MNVTLVKTTVELLDEMTQLIDSTPAAAKLSGAKLGLGKGLVTPGVATVFADLIECAFTGYARSSVIVWGAPINEPDGSVTSQSPATLFRCTAAGTPENVANVFVNDAVAAPNTGILAAARINPTIPIAAAGDGFTVVVDWNQGLNAANCQATIIV